MNKWVLRAIRVAGFALVLAGMAKLATSTGSAKILQETDPIFGTPNRLVLVLIGMLEISIGGYCIIGKDRLLQSRLLLWIGCMFTIYRVGLWWINYHKPCTCLGAITESIGLTETQADSIMKFVLGFVVSAGVAGLLNTRDGFRVRSSSL